MACRCLASVIHRFGLNSGSSGWGSLSVSLKCLVSHHLIHFPDDGQVACLTIVVHCGCIHSDQTEARKCNKTGLGLAQRMLWRLPLKPCVVLVCCSSKNPEEAELEDTLNQVVCHVLPF